MSRIRWRSAAVVLAGALLVGTACGSSDDDAKGASTTAARPDEPSTADGATSTSGTPAVDTGPAVPSRGCDATSAAPVSLDRRTVPVAELSRWYLITIPEGADPAEPMPLVLDFHGLTEGADAHAQMSGLGTYAESHGFVAVIPHGSGDLVRWAAAPGGSAGEPNIDVDFVTALLDQVEDTVCIDRSRVYATGLSNGAMLASMLACRLAGRLAAVAPIAGATVFDACVPAATVPMMTIHGTADPILLFNGGVGDLVKLISGGVGGGEGAATPPTTTIPTDLNGPGYPANVAAWADRNGCDPTPTDEAVTDTVTLRTYVCPTGADVEMYIVAGGGHAWPGSEFSRSIEQIIGPTTFDIDATDLIWKFFQRFRRV